MAVAFRPLPVALRFWVAGRFPRPFGTHVRSIFLDLWPILGGPGGILGPTLVIFSVKFPELISGRFFASVVPNKTKTRKMKKLLSTCKIRCFVRVAMLNKKSHACNKNSFFSIGFSSQIYQNLTKKRRKNGGETEGHHFR